LFGRLRPGPHGTAWLGRAELAHSGTLLLDQVSAASHSAQVRVLRLLETGMVERDGEGTPRRVDVRVLAATTRPLDLEVREGRFRDDLRRRLQVVRIRVPALRERRGDIALLGEHFLARHGAPRSRLSAAAATVLQACEWPGNVRQLESVMREVAAGIPPGVETPIEPQQLPEGLLASRNGTPATSHRPSEDRRTVLLRALSSHGGNRTAAARALGIGRATFYRWWREAGLGA
jgi:DNA-binding NtrC family response regulator